MRLKYEEGRFVIEPQTKVDYEALQVLSGSAMAATLSEAITTCAAGVGAATAPWELAVADALGAQLEGLPCGSADRVLRELRRMNESSATEVFDTPMRYVPAMPAQEPMNSLDEEKPPQGRLEDELLFDLRGPGGETWRLYLSGRSDGFPPGTVVVNHALPMVNASTTR